jgi:hypothetical protein
MLHIVHHVIFVIRDLEIIVKRGWRYMSVQVTAIRQLFQSCLNEEQEV